MFGGISVLSDQSHRRGRRCQIGKYVGTVEDVGLRTMRLRTLARTVVHVPNGTLATMEVENLSRRDKFLLQTALGLRYETTPEQLARVLRRSATLLAADTRVERDTRRVRFVRFGPYSLDVEVFAYLLVPGLRAVPGASRRSILLAAVDAGQASRSRRRRGDARSGAMSG